MRGLRSVEDLTGAVLAGRYRLQRLVAVGSTGTVYEGAQVDFFRRVAIKILHPPLAARPGVAHRFDVCARAAAVLSHPHIVDFVAVGGGATPFLVMEYLVGHTLADLMAGGRTISPQRAARIAVQALAALGAAHHAEIVHRDVKPEHLFLESTATGVDMVRVLDFGGALLLAETGAEVTATGVSIGTVAWMSPEQALGKRVDGRSDLYSLAATLYAAVSGRKPVAGETPLRLLSAVTRGTPPPRASGDPRLDAILLRALAKDPAARYQTADAMRDALEQWLASAPVPAVPERASVQTTPGPVVLGADEPFAGVPHPMPRIGAMFGRYEILEQLGAGGLGVVFRADDLRLGREVAIKVLRVASEATVQTLREARTAATIDHPSAIRVFDADEQDGVPYLVMELVQGRNLRSVIGDPNVDVDRKVRWLIEIARALAAAHRRSVIHHDVKPENIVVRDDDGAAKVLDFGISRRLFDVAPASGGGRLAGTPAYMAPEQLRGERGDALSDQFAWGVFAFELLTGELPWLHHGGLLHVVNEIATRAPDAPSRRRGDVPTWLDRVVLRALEKDPARRYPSMSDVADALGHGWETATMAGRPAEMAGTADVPTSPARRRRTWFVPLSAAAAVVLACGGWIGSTRAAANSAPSTADVAPAAPSTSSNAEAMTVYHAGVAAIRNAAGGAARRYFDRAVALDPSFAAAHMRRALVSSTVTDAERASVRKATQLRSTLSEHDAALLHAIEPWVGVPQDAPEVERRLGELAAAHQDAEYQYQLCRFRVIDGNYGRAIEACRAAREIDREFAGAFWLEGQSQMSLGETEAGTASVEMCRRIAPTATSCLLDQQQLRSNGGLCAEALADAKMMATLEPDRDRTLVELGLSLYGAGQPGTASQEAYTQALALMAPIDAQREGAILATREAVLAGDIKRAEAALDDWDRALVTNGEEAAHAAALSERAMLVHEFYSSAGALRDRASAFLAERAAWTPMSLDGRIVGLAALYRSGAMPRADFVAAREAWLFATRAVQTWPRWMVAYSDAAASQADAVETANALASVQIPADRFRYVADDEAIGAAYLVAGRTAEAMPFLTRAAHSCRAVRFPFHHTWANLELGQALESSDKGGACAAYRLVLSRWGSAARSRSAAIARARSAALGCAAH